MADTLTLHTREPSYQLMPRVYKLSVPKACQEYFNSDDMQAIDKANRGQLSKIRAYQRHTTHQISLLFFLSPLVM